MPCLDRFLERTESIMTTWLGELCKHDLHWMIEWTHYHNWLKPMRTVGARQNYQKTQIWKLNIHLPKSIIKTVYLSPPNEEFSPTKISWPNCKKCFFHTKHTKINHLVNKIFLKQALKPFMNKAVVNPVNKSHSKQALNLYEQSGWDRNCRLRLWLAK